MNKQTLDLQLKNDSKNNRFTVEGDFIVFDSKCNLEYEIIPFFTLKQLLTKNPISSYTKLSKGLILWLHRIRTDFGKPITINSGYRSPEYNILFPGSAVNSFHTKGLAFDLGTTDVEGLYSCIKALQLEGEIGLYDTFIHIAPTGGSQFWDKRKKKSLPNYLDNDDKRNYAIYLVLGLLALFLLKKR